MISTLSSNTLYWYQDIYNLVFTTSAVYVDNRTMNPRQVKAHKGVTNEILFNIRNRDRKLQNVATKTLTISLVDPETQRHILSKELEDTLDIGKVQLTLLEGDLETIPAGTYWAHITHRDLGLVDRPLYSDQDNNMRFEFHITDQASSSCDVTQEWTNTGNSNVSMNFDGNANQNFANPTHTVLVYTDGFTGNIDIQASLIPETPNAGIESSDWFTVDTITVTDANVTTVTETFQVNCVWVRTVASPTAGSITKVQIRN